MTPAERARQIDKEEFAAECAAIRERAFAYASERRRQERQTVRKSIGREETAGPKAVMGKPAKLHAYNGEALTLAQWAKRLGISVPSLYQRRKTLGSLEAAIAMGGPQRRGPAPGVVSNFEASEGTGAGRHAHEISEISFSDQKAPTE